MNQFGYPKLLGSLLALILSLPSLCSGASLNLIPGDNARGAVPEEVDRWTLDLGYLVPTLPANHVLFESGDDGTGVIVALVDWDLAVYVDQGDRTTASPDGDLFVKVGIGGFENQVVSIRLSVDLTGEGAGSDTLQLDVGNGISTVSSGKIPFTKDLGTCLGTGDFALAARGRTSRRARIARERGTQIRRIQHPFLPAWWHRIRPGIPAGKFSPPPRICRPREPCPPPGSWEFLAAYPRPGEPMATIVVSGDVRNGTGRLTVTRDISFTLQANVPMRGILFQNWTPGDGSSDRMDLTPSSIYYRVNDGPLQSAPVQFADNPGQRWGVVSPNDGYIRFAEDIQGNLGDRFTFYAGTWEIAPSPTFTAPPVGFLTTPCFVADGQGTVQSPLPPITIEILPEPWTWQPPTDSLTRFRLETQGNAPVLTWDPNLTNPSLEVSPDLRSWRAVTSPVFGNFFVIPTTQRSAYYRLRFDR